MDRLNWSKLKTFYRVASCGSFARAAEKYNKKSLEYELNCQLFTRNETGIELTPKGQMLYRDALRISNMLTFTEEKIQEDYKHLKSHLKLVCPVGLSTMYISYFIDSFMHTYPDIYLEIVSYDAMSLNEKLAGHVLIHPFIKDLNGYKQDLLINMQFKLFASKEYLKKHGNPKSIDDLNDHRLIAFSRDKRVFVDVNWHLKIGMPEGEERTPVFEADANFGRCRLAERGVGIISVPTAHPDIKNYGLVEVLPEVGGPEYSYYLIVDEILYENEKICFLTDALKKIFTDL